MDKMENPFKIIGEMRLKYLHDYELMPVFWNGTILKDKYGRILLDENK